MELYARTPVAASDSTRSSGNDPVEPLGARGRDEVTVGRPECNGTALAADHERSGELHGIVTAQDVLHDEGRYHSERRTPDLDYGEAREVSIKATQDRVAVPLVDHVLARCTGDGRCHLRICDAGHCRPGSTQQPSHACRARLLDIPLHEGPRVEERGHR